MLHLSAKNDVATLALLGALVGCANAKPGSATSDSGNGSTADAGPTADASCGAFCDHDHDGVVDGTDQCPNTPPGETRAAGIGRSSEQDALAFAELHHGRVDTARGIHHDAYSIRHPAMVPRRHRQRNEALSASLTVLDHRATVEGGCCT